MQYRDHQHFNVDLCNGLALCEPLKGLEPDKLVQNRENEKVRISNKGAQLCGTHVARLDVYN